MTGGRDEKGRSIGVTPQVLARPVLDLMAAHLETIAGEDFWCETHFHISFIYNFYFRKEKRKEII